MAQSGQKFSTGGINLGSGEFFGTLNSYPLITKVNNTEMMRITPNGFVGIGNNNPVYKLDVGGRLHASGDIIADSTITAMNLYALQKVSCDALEVNNNALLGSLNVNGISSFAGQVNAGNVTITGTLGNGTLSTNVSEIKNHLDNPAIHRSINDAGSSTTDLWSASKIISAIAITPANNPVLFAHINNSAIHRSINDAGSSTTDLWSAGKIISSIAAASVSDSMNIVNYFNSISQHDIILQGKLGIGTNNPLEMLDVNGNANIRGTLYVENGVIIGKRVTSENVITDTLQAARLQIAAIQSQQVAASGVQADSANVRHIVSDSVNTLHIATEKLTVAGNARIIGDAIVTGTIGTSGLIISSKVSTDTMVSHSAIFDSIAVAQRVQSVNIIAQNIAAQYATAAVSSADSAFALRLAVEGDAKIKGNVAVKGKITVDSLSGNGFKLDSLSVNSYKLVFADQNGNLTCKLPPDPYVTPAPCTNNLSYSPWLTNGNNLGNSDPNILGTCSNHPINLMTDGSIRMTIYQDGNVFIGKAGYDNCPYKLDVDGNIRANKVVVNTTGADFVFNDDYKLMSLPELEKSIKENKHLPGAPSAEEMQNNGMSLGETNTLLLQKVEELTLYVIELQKQNEALSKRLDNIENK